MSDTSLKEKTAKGLFWGGFSNGIQQLLNLGFGIVLARLLDASDYGMVGMLTIFSAIAAGGWVHFGTDQPEGDFAQGLQRRVLVQPDVQHYYIYITLLCRTADCRLLRYARADTAVPSLLLGIRHFQHEHCTEGISIQEPQNQGHYRHFYFKSDSLRHYGHHIGGKRIRLLGNCTAKHLFHHRNDGSQFLLLALETPLPVRLYTYQGDDRVQQ